MRYPFIDMHCDSLLEATLDPSRNLWDCEKSMLDIRSMAESGQLAQFFAVFFPPKWHPGMPEIPSLMNAPEENELFDRAVKELHREVEAHADLIALACSGAQVRENQAAGKASAILTIEDGRFVEGRMEKLAWLREQGVTAIALTWNFANCFGYPNSTKEAEMARGLTAFGVESVAEMNRLGILIDVSHLNDGGFWDVVKHTQKPFIASHSNCRAICGHPRNLTDEMIRALADCGGVAGINFNPPFLRDAAKHTDVESLAAHAMHLFRVGGEDLCALGTDFDGISGTFEIGRPQQMHLLFAALAKAGMTERQIEKFASGNVLRVLDTLN